MTVGPHLAEVLATHAALTGHLVLSTLHTNDAATALTRLIDLGIESYLVASTVEAVLAQRLVRKICESCKRPDRLTSEQRAALELAPNDLPQVWSGAGCDACRGTGYRGRTGIYELMEDHRGDTFRAVYTVRIGDAVHVLHAFQKKSKSGIATPRPDVELIEKRLKAVLAGYGTSRRT